MVTWRKVTCLQWGLQAVFTSVCTNTAHPDTWWWSGFKNKVGQCVSALWMEGSPAERNWLLALNHVVISSQNIKQYRNNSIYLCVLFCFFKPKLHFFVFWYQLVEPLSAPCGGSSLTCIDWPNHQLHSRHMLLRLPAYPPSIIFMLMLPIQ